MRRARFVLAKVDKGVYAPVRSKVVAEALEPLALRRIRAAGARTPQPIRRVEVRKVLVAYCTLSCTSSWCFLFIRDAVTWQALGARYSRQTISNIMEEFGIAVNCAALVVNAQHCAAMTLVWALCRHRKPMLWTMKPSTSW